MHSLNCLNSAHLVLLISGRLFKCSVIIRIYLWNNKHFLITYNIINKQSFTFLKTTCIVATAFQFHNSPLE